MTRSRRPKRQRPCRSRQPRRLASESLEPRQMLSGISLYGGELRIIGESQADSARVWIEKSSVCAGSPATIG